MKKVSALILALLLSSNNVAQAKWHHYALGGVLGYLVGKSTQPQPQQQPPLDTAKNNLLGVSNNHNIISCKSHTGYLCDYGTEQNLTPAQMARKAGFKYIHKFISDPSQKVIYIEVSN